MSGFRAIRCWKKIVTKNKKRKVWKKENKVISEKENSDDVTDFDWLLKFLQKHFNL